MAIKVKKGLKTKPINPRNKEEIQAQNDKKREKNLYKEYKNRIKREKWKGKYVYVIREKGKIKTWTKANPKQKKEFILKKARTRAQTEKLLYKTRIRWGYLAVQTSPEYLLYSDRNALSLKGKISFSWIFLRTMNRFKRQGINEVRQKIRQAKRDRNIKIQVIEDEGRYHIINLISEKITYNQSFKVIKR